MITTDMYKDQILRDMGKSLGEMIDSDIIDQLNQAMTNTLYNEIKKLLTELGFVEINSYNTIQYITFGPIITRLYPEYALLYISETAKTEKNKLKKLVSQCDLSKGGVVVTSKFMTVLYVKHKQSDKVKLMLKIAGDNQ